MRFHSATALALIFTGAAFACAGSKDATATDEAPVSVQKLADLVGLGNFTTPDTGNIWTQNQVLSKYAIGQENPLESVSATLLDLRGGTYVPVAKTGTEDELFTAMAEQIGKMFSHMSCTVGLPLGVESRKRFDHLGRIDAGTRIDEDERTHAVRCEERCA